MLRCTPMQYKQAYMVNIYFFPDFHCGRNIDSIVKKAKSYTLQEHSEVRNIPIHVHVRSNIGLHFPIVSSSNFCKIVIFSSQERHLAEYQESLAALEKLQSRLDLHMSLNVS